MVVRNGVVISLALLAIAPSMVRCQEAPRFDAAKIEFFEKKIRPLLVANCYTCHSADTNSKGGLRVDDRNGLLHGGDRGAAIVPGDPEKSLLIRAVSHTDDDLKMPPEKQLSAEQVAVLTQWIRDGAAWPLAEAPPRWANRIPSTTRCAKSTGPGSRFATRSRPRCATAPGRRNDVDAFLLAALEQRGVKPVGDADRTTLIRRLSFDLTGLPPTPDEIDAFARDGSPDALRTGRRSAAGLARVRRALGPALARRRPLRRVDRLVAQHSLPARLALSRLRHRRVQQRQAVRPVHPRADRRRPAAGRFGRGARRAADRHRLPGAGREGRESAVQGPLRHGQHRRADRHGQPLGPGPDGELRPLPRPQVRPDPDDRLLRPGRHLPQHRPVRRRAQQDGGRRPGLLRHADALAPRIGFAVGPG